MSLPGNGIFVVQGEMNMLVTAMRRSTRWGSHSFPNEEYDVLMKTFQDLKTILCHVDDLRLLDPATYLGPFLEVIRSKETSGPVTSLALSAIHKFLSYGLIDPTHPSVPATVEDIAEAVTHARFVGTDHSSDGVVLMKILQVLRTLMLSPEGVMLTDESVCEIMLSCFRICFETRLTELLRRNAEQCLRDMTQLVFMRLPQFPAEAAGGARPLPAHAISLKKRDKRERERDTKRKTLPAVNSTNSLERKTSLSEQTIPNENVIDADASKAEALRHNQDKNLLNEAEITIEPVELKSHKHARHSSMDLAGGNTSITQLLEKCVSAEPERQTEDRPVEEPSDPDGVCVSKQVPSDPVEPSDKSSKEEQPTELAVEEYVNHRGIRFTAQQQQDQQLQPYALLCVRELFRFLISLCNPLDSQNTSGMVHLGLSLVATALEVAADTIPATPSLLALVKDPLAKNLLTLLNTERISIFALDLQVSFLLFESMRFHLKFQMEANFKKLIEIISADTSKAVYELKEIHHLSLESLIQFFKIPGLCAELYINYDCDIYCMDVFEELTKLLSKNVISATAYDTHQLSLEALLTILEAIEMGQKDKGEIEITVVEGERETKVYGRDGHVTLELGGMEDSSVCSDHVTHDISQYMSGRGRVRTCVPASASAPTDAELDNIKNIKKWVTQGTELFNQKPERGIEFLQEHGVLKTPLDPHEVAMFLRENPDLDKKMIGEYICKRSSRECDSDDGSTSASGGVLGAFADSFTFNGLRIDQALRLYLETFRLPGEAPLIFLVMERFAERWHSTNGEPFANTDAAFRLAYAVIMLNMDQHNHNAKKLNVPMTAEDFVKNLRGCNGSGDFEQSMLEQIYHSIKNEEMVMPAERSGAVRTAYLWRVLQRRGDASAGVYRAAHTLHHARLGARATEPTVAALSAAFERAPAPSLSELESNSGPALLALGGLERAAALVVRLPPDSLTLDSLLLSLCKFTQLLHHQFTNHIAIGVTLGQSTKARAALVRACSVYAKYAHAVRTAWRYLLDVLTTLFLGRLLPQCLVEVEDIVTGARVSLVREAARGADAGLLSSIYSYIALGDAGGMRAPTPNEKSHIDLATDCVAKCNIPGLLITETKFLQVESLQELVQAMIAAGTPPDPENVQLNPQLEDVTIFYLELLGQLLIQNRDRLWCVWEAWAAHVSSTVAWAGSRPGAAARALTCSLRTCARLLRTHQCAPHALHHLAVLLQLPYRVFYHHARLISCGIYELIKTSAQNLHSSAEWELVFTVLCAAGAGAWPRNRPKSTVASSTSSRSEGSEDESERRPQSVSSDSELSTSPQTQGWIMVQKESSVVGSGTASSVEDEWGDVVMRPHRGEALVRCCEALALVVRDVAHVTPHNCRHAVRAARLLARAARNIGESKRKGQEDRKSTRSRSRSSKNEESSDEEVDTLDQYHMVSLQLLDLMHTLHSRTAQIFKWWKDEAEQDGKTCAEDYDLWEVAWKPLLQGIAEFCTDRRKQVANSGLAYLQRALLAPGLSGVGGAGWEQCFTCVLFPLLQRRAPTRRARANTILCKVFLQHLSALAPRPGFPALWGRVVAVQRDLVLAPGDDALAEAARETLKNMILVMDSVRIFSNGAGEEYNELWYSTWNLIDEFLPNLKDELFPQAKDASKPPTNFPSHMQVPLPASLPTIIPVAPNQVSPQNSPPIFLPNSPTFASIPTFQPSPTSAFVPVSPKNLASMANGGQSPVNVGQSPVNVGQSPVNIGQSAPSVGHTPQLVAPTAITGMVPIRNPLYDQAGLTSSVLLQPLNEMKSTPISVSIQSQPHILPQTEAKIDPNPTLTESNLDQDTIIISPNIEQEELYTEYLTNPYNESKFPTKEATLYDPENLTTKLLDKQKSFSENTTPMHKNKAQFGSTDNVRESGVFNFSNYFSGEKPAGAEVFDSLITHEG